MATYFSNLRQFFHGKLKIWQTRFCRASVITAYQGNPILKYLKLGYGIITFDLHSMIYRVRTTK